ncbi:MAG TPA: HlyD family efflux transporter periplasmic adaptor subunit [Candidatus Hydrogenedentes bacterium]|nr:HlyD family efflux transporter periplasmic adaptor subunit [Candidatus Hydrogenedentota bacterium]
MNTREREVIRTPIGRWVKQGLQRSMPALVWLTAVVALVFLGQRQMVRSMVIPGMVEIREMGVAPFAEGALRSLSVNLYDTVKAGQVIGMMDDTLINGELITAEAGLKKIRAELEAERIRTTLTAAQQTDETRRFFLDMEQNRLDILDRFSTLEADRTNMIRLESMIKQGRELVEAGILDPSTFEQDRLTYEALKSGVEEGDKALAEMKAQNEASAKYIPEHPAQSLDAQLATALKLISEAIDAQELCIQEILERQKKLVLRAPFDGKVAQIFYGPGATVPVGMPVLTVAESEGRRVVAYVDENALISLKEGDTVEVFHNTNPRQVVLAKVLKTSPIVAEFPLHLRRNPALAQWGHPVLMGELPPGMFFPGQAVSVRSHFQ